MHTHSRRWRPLGRAALLAAALAFATPTAANAFNDEYVFAATKGVNDMDMHPALKITLIPLTVVADVVFLPFAVIAGIVS